VLFGEGDTRFFELLEARGCSDTLDVGGSVTLLAGGQFKLDLHVDGVEVLLLLHLHLSVGCI